MSGQDLETAKWDPAFTRRTIKSVTPLIRTWFRPEVRGVEAIPRAGGALVVSNHSGGALTPDWLVFAPTFYDRFGYDRPLYTLAHYGVFLVPWAGALGSLGVVHASRDNALRALHSGAVVLDFPGGDYDAFRPTLRQNVVDFEGRTGYVSVALEADVPIVPAVSIGGQEMQLFVSRGASLARRLGLHRIRMDILPITVGVPFGPTVIFPPNIPMPTKIVFQVLPPIDIRARFGANPDVHEVDAHVRAQMQQALDLLADERRLPILG